MATQEQIDAVRLYCFNPSQTELPDEVIGAQIDKWLAIYPLPKDIGIVMFNATIDCLWYLVLTDPNASGGTGGSSVREKIGQVEKELGYTGEYVSRWKKLLDGYLDGSLTIPGYRRATSHVIIGGVERCKIDAIKYNPNSVDGLKGLGVDTRKCINPGYVFRSRWY